MPRLAVICDTTAIQEEDAFLKNPEHRHTIVCLHASKKFYRQNSICIRWGLEDYATILFPPLDIGSGDVAVQPEVRHEGLHVARGEGLAQHQVYARRQELRDLVLEAGAREADDEAAVAVLAKLFDGLDASLRKGAKKVGKRGRMCRHKSF